MCEVALQHRLRTKDIPVSLSQLRPTPSLGFAIHRIGQVGGLGRYYFVIVPFPDLDHPPVKKGL